MYRYSHSLPISCIIEQMWGQCAQEETQAMIIDPDLGSLSLSHTHTHTHTHTEAHLINNIILRMHLCLRVHMCTQVHVMYTHV